MPFQNSPPPHTQITIRLKDWTAQVRRKEDDVSPLLPIQLHHPLAPLGGYLLRRGRLLPFLCGFLPYFHGRQCEWGRSSVNATADEKVGGGAVVWLAEEDDGRAKKATGELRRFAFPYFKGERRGAEARCFRKLPF